MGMFDYVRFGAELPGNPPAIEWQTKDTPAQWCDTYEIRDDGSLWHQNYDTEYRSDPSAEGLVALAGCMTSVNHRWEPCHNFTGEIRFYGYEGDDTKLWWEYSAYLSKGQLKHIELIRSPATQRHGRGESST
jgi:hypothetical protein